MSIRFAAQLALFALLAFTFIGWINASAAANFVPPSALEDTRSSISPDDLKPAACSAQYVTKLIVDTGIFTGTSGNDLMIGGSSTDVIYGGGGNDCILGGGGNDTLIGGGGNDVCMGGPGTDIIDLTCE